MGDVVLPGADEVLTLEQMVEYICLRAGDAPAFEWRGSEGIEQVSRGEFLRDCYAATAYMTELPDVRVAVLGENSYPWVLAFLGASCCGKAAVALDKDAPAGDLEQMLDTAACSTLFYSAQYAGLVTEVARASGVCAICFDDLMEALSRDDGDACADPAGDVTAPACWQPVHDPDRVALILFTSGTTGQRKGVPLTHGNIRAAVIPVCRLQQVGGKQVAALPFHHCFGLIATVLMPMMLGSTTFITSSFRYLPVDVKYCKPSSMNTVPAVIEMFVKLTRAYKDPANLYKALGPQFEFFVSGGGPLKSEVRELCERAGIRVLEGFGMTETASAVLVKPFWLDRPGSVGLPCEGTEVRVSDEGELLLRGEPIMRGYLDNPEADAQAFADGWLRTGDLARIGDAGEVYIVGRVKKLIVLANGENIPAEPLEALIYELPYVKEARVYGRDGLITAEVYPDPEAGDVTEQLKADVDVINRSLPLNQCIMRTLVRDTEFPKTSSGKIKL